jgi:hypothetical protein
MLAHFNPSELPKVCPTRSGSPLKSRIPSTKGIPEMTMAIPGIVCLKAEAIGIETAISKSTTLTACQVILEQVNNYSVTSRPAFLNSFLI